MRRILGNVGGWLLGLLGHRIAGLVWHDGDRIVTCRCGVVFGVRPRWDRPPAIAPVSGSCVAVDLFRWSRRAPWFVVTLPPGTNPARGPYR